MNSPIRVPRRCITADGELTEESTTCKVSEGQKCTKKGICYDLDVPEEYSESCWHNVHKVYKQGRGSDSDLLIFVSVQQLEELANAIYCQSVKTTGRPLILEHQRGS